MGVTFRRFLFLVMVLIYGGYYLKQRYRLKDLLDYMQKNPDSIVAMPVTDYSIGMIYFMRDEHEGAIEAFNQLLTNYPTGYFVEDSLVRLGESYEEVRNWPKARETYQQYMQQYPQGKSRAIVESEYEHIKFN